MARHLQIAHNGPTPLWDSGHPIRNAHILREGPTTDVVSFLGADPSYPAWFTVVIERRTLHLRSVQMTAAAHFMHARYVSWNERSSSNRLGNPSDGGSTWSVRPRPDG